MFLVVQCITSHTVSLGNGKQLLNLWPTSFAFAGVLVAWLGIGTFSQVNSITASLQNSFDWSPKIVSVILALITAAIIFGGIQSISKVSEKVVPFMAGLYILAALVVIFTNFNQLLPVLEMVFQSAFTGKAAVEWFAGATVMVAMRLGIARGVFSNESGLGSALSLQLPLRPKNLLNKV